MFNQQTSYQQYQQQQHEQSHRSEQCIAGGSYQPLVTQVNIDDPIEVEHSGISQAGMLMDQQVVKPGAGFRKFTRDAQGYTEPQITFEGTLAPGQHVPTPIPSNLTFRGDCQMNSRESTLNDNSATLPIMDNESDEWSSSSSGAASRRLKNIVIKKQSTREDHQMNTQNSEPMDTSMRHSSLASQQQMSSENMETQQKVSLRTTRENFEEADPGLNQPAAQIDEPEEEFKLSPRQPNTQVHFTPQIKVTPLMEQQEIYNASNIPNTQPLKPRTVDEEEKQRAKSMMTLLNGGIRQNATNSKLMQRRNKLNLKLRCDSWGSSRSGSVKQYSSEAEMLQLTLEENQARCDFFKHFMYNAKDKLGTGCSSDVYLCTPMPQEISFVTVKSAHLSSNSSTTASRQLCVKVCDTSDENKAKAVLNEVQILKRIECELINQLVAFYEDPQVNKSYLVLEFAGSQSLTQFIAEKKQEIELPTLQSSQNISLSKMGSETAVQVLNEDVLRSIMRQLFQATEYMHRNNICHRDLKPDNIMISYYVDPVNTGNLNDSSSQASGSEIEPIKIKVIDLNVAFEVTPENPKICFGTGLKEWSAPETRNQLYTDFKIDSWSLGCVMFFISTGEPPFAPEQPIDIDEDFNLWLKLQSYQDSPTFPEMVDFMSKLLVVDPENRLTSLEALRHPWINASPYLDNSTLRRLQLKVMSKEALSEAEIETSNISPSLQGKPQRANSTTSAVQPHLDNSKTMNLPPTENLHQHFAALSSDLKPSGGGKLTTIIDEESPVQRQQQEEFAQLE